MQIFNPYWQWLLDGMRDPDVWFFLLGPGFTLVAGVIMGVLYLVFWVMEAWDTYKLDQEIRANRDT